MCAIYGIIDFNKKLNLENELITMGKSMKNRGPDNSSIHVQEEINFQIGLGHNRLAIIDLSDSANQPFKFEHFTLVFNGEIYNYREIREQLKHLSYTFKTDSDTEVVIKSFDAWGISSIKKFIGMFAFCIYDAKKEDCYIVRDRLGIKPLYYYWDGIQFSFGSELKAIMGLSTIDIEVNKNSLALFFSLGYIPREHCIIDKTNKLEPGNYLQFNLNKKEIQISTYWDIKTFFRKPSLIVPRKENLIKEELKDLFKSAFEYRMVADVPVGAFLSGGYDSSLLTAFIAKDYSDLKTFTIGFEDPKYDESEYAKQVAKYLGTEHFELKCTINDAKNIIPKLPYIYDEPFGDYSSIPTLLVSDFAKDQVKVVLSADGGDEIFGGYNRYNKTINNYSKLEKIPLSVRKLTSQLIKSNQKIIKKVLASSYRIDHKLHSVSEYLKQSNDISILNDLTSQRINKLELKMLFQEDVCMEMFSDFEKDKISEFSNLSKLLIFDFKYYLPDDILVKVDRATMASSIEGREPLLDHRIVEYAAQIPDNLKIRGDNKKHILKEILHEIMPKELLDRPKKGFGVPLHDWFREDLKVYLFDYILDRDINKQGFFNGEYVKRRVNSYIEGNYNDWDFTWHMLVFQMWYYTWIKK